MQELIKSLFPKMDPEVKARWVARLRDPETKQTTGRLGRLIDGEKHMCCLGVLVDEMKSDAIWLGGNLQYQNDQVILTNPEYGLNEGTIRLLAGRNDGTPYQLFTDDDGENTFEAMIYEVPAQRRWTFSEIADFIEEYL